MADGDFKYPLGFKDGEVPSRFDSYRKQVQAAADKHGVPLDLLYGLIMKESSGFPNKTGDDTHGQGLFQIDDRYHKPFLDKHHNGRDIGASADYAARLLASNAKAFGGDWRKAVAAYNAGVGGVNKALHRGRDEDTATTGGDHAAKVMDYARQFRPHLGLPPDQIGPVERPENTEVAVRDFKPLPAPGEAVPAELPVEDVAPETDVGPLASSGGGGTFMQNAFRSVANTATGANPDEATEDAGTDGADASVTDATWEEPQVGPTSGERLAEIRASHAPHQNFEVNPELRQIHLPKAQVPLTPEELAAAGDAASPTGESPAQRRDLLSEYRNAKSEGDRIKAVNDMRLGIDQISRAFTKTPRDAAWEKRLTDESEGPVKDALTEASFEAKLGKARGAVGDPNSPASRAARMQLIVKRPNFVRDMGGIKGIEGLTDKDVAGLLKNDTTFDKGDHQQVGDVIKAQAADTAGTALNVRTSQGQDRIDLKQAAMGEQDDKEKYQRHVQADKIVGQYQKDTAEIKDLAVPARNIERIVRAAGFDPGVVPESITPGGFATLANQYAPGMDRIIREQLASGDPAKIKATQDAIDGINQQFEKMKLAESHPIAGSSRTKFEDAQWKSIQGSGVLNTPAQKWLYINSVSKDVQHKLAGAEQVARTRVDTFVPPEKGKKSYFDIVMGGADVIRSNDPLLNGPARTQPEAPKGTKAAPSRASTPKPAPAQGATKLSADDQAAINWAKAHPDDASAKEILALHGIK